MFSKSNAQLSNLIVNECYKKKSGKKKPNKLKSYGFTAIELLLVLGVIAAATVGILYGISNSKAKSSSTQMMSDVSSLVNEIGQLYSSSSAGYTGLSNEVAINAGIVPKDLVFAAGGSTITDQWGGAVVLAVGSDVQGYTISYASVPASVCQQVINGLGGALFSQIDVNDTKVYDATTALDPTVVATNCSKGNATIKFSVGTVSGT